MTNAIIVYTATLVLITAIIFQLQLAFASSIESLNESQSVVNNSTIEPHSEPSQATKNLLLNSDDIVHCAALGCPGNPPNPHGRPTEENHE